MSQYHIHLATDPKKMFQEIDRQPREYAGFVEANSLDEAFKNSQNLDESWNKQSPCRSTSVGDVIQNDVGFYMILGQGFKKIF